MNNLIITGPAASGKTYQAKMEVLKYPQEKVVWIEGQPREMQIPEDTELVVFDAVQLNWGSLKKLKRLSLGRWWVFGKDHKLVKIKPRIVVTTQDPMPDKPFHRFEVLKLPSITSR